jgi:hypothetical protein
MKRQSSLALIGLAAGVALGLFSGYMMFDRSIYGRVNKKLKKSRRALERAQAEWRDAACNVIESGREQIEHVRSKGKRVVNELAS